MVSFATPSYKHLTSKDYKDVYEPAEDTFLMLDALEKDVENIQKVSASICLEIGPGSGLVITFLSQILDQSVYFLASDVNRYACEATRKTADENKKNIECVEDRSLRSLKHRLEKSVDILVFNPPYVVTPSEEDLFINGIECNFAENRGHVGCNDIRASWAGGIYGREVIDELLPIIVKILSRKGCFYLLLLEENKPDEIISWMSKHGFEHEVIIRRKTGPERLLVVRFSRSDAK